MCGHKDNKMSASLARIARGLKRCCGVLLTRSLGGAPGQGAGDVAFHVAQQSQAEARTVRHPEQNLASLPCVVRAPQRVVYVNVHRGTRQRLAGHHVPHQDLQGKLGLWRENAIESLDLDSVAFAWP